MNNSYTYNASTDDANYNSNPSAGGIRTFYFYGDKVWDCSKVPHGFMKKQQLKPGHIVMLTPKKFYRVMGNMSWKRIKKGQEYKELKELQI